MYYIVESSKSFYEATFDLEPVIQRLGFVLLHREDLGEMLRRKEIDFADDCEIFDVGSYRPMEKLLAGDMRLALGLPWRIAVFTDNGATKIGLVRPSGLLAALGTAAELAGVAREIEEKLIQIVDETR